MTIIVFAYKELEKRVRLVILFTVCSKIRYLTKFVQMPFFIAKSPVLLVPAVSIVNKYNYTVWKNRQ